VSYRLILSKPAVKALRGVAPQEVARIATAIEDLKDEPRPSGCRKLQGREDLWRIRIGDYRVIYAIDDVVEVIDVRRIGHRGDIYR
jgi:mRNA interferase RelE/StbE